MTMQENIWHINKFELRTLSMTYRYSSNISGKLITISYHNNFLLILLTGNARTVNSLKTENPEKFPRNSMQLQLSPVQCNLTFAA